MNTQHPPDLEEAPRNESKLASVLEAARHMRTLRLQLADAEQEVTRLSKALNDVEYRGLPDLFDEAGVESVTISAEGNQPGYTVSVQPYYYANIPASWPPDKRNAAFVWLEGHGHGDLIKTEVVVTLSRRDREAAVRVCNALDKLGVSYTERLSVPWNTYTAWLKEMVRKGTTLPLDLLNATVGRVAKMKETK